MGDYVFPMKNLAKGNNLIQPCLVKTYKETIYLYLREAIITHHLKPRERIHEKVIAQKFGVSTTPVREAFVKLEGEGFLKIDANRRVTVKPLSILELSEICEVIGVLDGFATRLAVRNSDRALVDEIERLTLEMEKFHKEKRVAEYLDSNILIHSKIWEASGNQFLNEKLQHMASRIRTFHLDRLYLYSKSRVMYKSLEGHTKLVEIFNRSFNEDNIETFCRGHWASYSEYLNKETKSPEIVSNQLDGIFSG